MERMTYRNIQNFLLFFTILALVLSFYVAHVQNIEPCPLCLMQRFCAFVFGFFCVVGLSMRTLHRSRMVALIQVLIAGLGLYFASRQLWLQLSPPTQPDVCLPGIEAMMQYFSYNAIFKAFFWGSSDCAKVTSSWLGLSIPAWSAIYFAIMAITNIILMVLLTRTLTHITERDVSK